ncbi:hypothetical protein MKK67_11585 [Methylobacterium sp. J-072]|uniref:DUF6883 domain-containing protein n=1 Tax=Methylobacterium sp. J-072 TaxID=2836651 RepID=UPI001FB9C5AC|nr:DUF6883 domain-containing protein [Methylobacterium sp. J-072]MCJ2093133.1 hypothetical protein [Methylobacterium sp. J-072]
MPDLGDWTPELTIVSTKTIGYLLNLSHRTGRHKAKWFYARGFSAEFDPPFLSALFAHGKPVHLVREFDTEFGRRYVYEGPLVCPDGTSPPFRSVWQSSGMDERRFLVTAYPL